MTRVEPGGTSKITDYSPGLATLDSRGRPWLIEQPDGSYLDNRYDETGFRTSVTVWDAEPPPSGSGTQIHRLDFEPDDRGRLSAVTENGAGTARYTYDANGRIDYIEYFSDPAQTTPAELSVKYDWADDPRPRLLQMLWTVGPANPPGATVAQIDYTLDYAGHRTQLRHQGEIGDQAIFYASDDTYRLLRETHHDYTDGVVGDPDFEIEYRYDAVGNRTRRIDRSGPTLAVVADTISAYDDNDRLLSAGATSYGWDDRGRLTSENDGMYAIAYDWADDDRLLSVAGGAVDVYYGYDGEQRLIERTAGSSPTEKFIVDSGFQYAQALVEYTGDLPASYTVKAKHVFGHRLLGEKRGATTDWTVTDALGSVRGLATSSSGAFTGSWGYEAYGPGYETASEELTHRFAGEARDQETGLDYLRARWMQPGRGSFAVRDPFEGDLSWPASRPPYLYAALQPADRFDPGGRESIASVSTAAKLVGVVAVAYLFSPNGHVKQGRPGRHLTSGELRMVHDVFGGTVQTADVRIFAEPFDDAWPAGVAHTIGNGVYFFPGDYRPDFSSGPPNVSVEDKYTFIHEMVHIWQGQHGVPVVRRAAPLHIKSVFVPGYSPYKYSPPTPTTTWLSYNVEQQGDVVADLWWYSKYWLPHLSNTRLVDQYRRVVPFPTKL